MDAGALPSGLRAVHLGLLAAGRQLLAAILPAMALRGAGTPAALARRADVMLAALAHHPPPGPLDAVAGSEFIDDQIRHAD